jgi:hypothetical protein
LRGGVGGGGVSADQAGYPFDDFSRIKQRILVFDSNHGVAALLKPGFAFRVTRGDGGVVVNAAIDLDDQPRSMTNKVHDVGAKWRLATEMGSVEVKLPQRLPKSLFSQGSGRSQLRRKTLAPF